MAASSSDVKKPQLPNLDIAYALQSKKRNYVTPLQPEYRVPFLQTIILKQQLVLSPDAWENVSIDPCQGNYMKVLWESEIWPLTLIKFRKHTGPHEHSEAASVSTQTFSRRSLGFVNKQCGLRISTTGNNQWVSVTMKSSEKQSLNSKQGLPVEWY